MSLEIQKHFYAKNMKYCQVNKTYDWETCNEPATHELIHSRVNCPWVDGDVYCLTHAMGVRDALDSTTCVVIVKPLEEVEEDYIKHCSSWSCDCGHCEPWES